MIRLTLYKNCILNDSYKNLFYTGKALLTDDDTVLDTYLNSLTKLIIDNEQISNTYQENTGTMVFSFENATNENIYEFNYMKIEWRILNEQGEPIGTWLKRYCFIDDIRIKNDVAYFDYTEDVFSSFVNSELKTDVFKLSRHRVLGSWHTGEPVELPTEYDGNNALTITKTQTISMFNIIAKLQVYKTDSLGKVTDRTTKIVMLARRIISTDTTTIDFTEATAEKLIANATVNQSTSSFYYQLNVDPTKTCFYEIDDFVIVPENWGLSAKFQFANQMIFNATVPWWDMSNEQIRIYDVSPSYKYLLTACYTKTLTADYKRLSIGTFSSQFPIIENKTSVDFNVKYYITDTSFKLYFNFSNQVIDITQDFIYNCPFTAINGAENYQRLINRNIGNLTSMVKLGTSIGGGISAYEELDMQIKGLQYTPKGNITKSKKKLNRISQLRSRQEENFYDTVENSGNGIIDLIKTNLPIYSSNKGTFIDNESFLNAQYGICYLYLNSDNNDYVKERINETGYVTYHFDTSLANIGFYNYSVHNTLGAKWDIYQFEDITLYGNFPRNIGKSLEKIFKDGFKMFYVAEPVITDTYVVG